MNNPTNIQKNQDAQKPQDPQKLQDASKTHESQKQGGDPSSKPGASGSERETEAAGGNARTASDKASSDHSKTNR